MSHNKLNYLELFHKNGYRVTRQRQAILEALCQADGHATIGEIYYLAKALDAGINRSTIYRSLEVFSKLGLVLYGEGVDGERVYELAKEHHHHLICKSCGQEIEIDNWILEDFRQILGSEYDYDVEIEHLIVFGTCPKCSNKTF